MTPHARPDSKQPSSNVMDQLSDWLGRFLPGGYRLPSRHPAKVTLVMGLSGIFCGWIVAVALVGARTSGLPPSGMIAVVGSLWGAVVGLMVFSPLARWSGRSTWSSLGGILLCTLIGWMHLFAPFQVGESAAGALSGLGYGLVGCTMFGRRGLPLVIPVMLTCAFLPQYMNSMTIALSQFRWIRPFRMAMWLAAVAHTFGSIAALVGIAFGSLIWDRTPRPRIEPTLSAD